MSDFNYNSDEKYDKEEKNTRNKSMLLIVILIMLLMLLIVPVGFALVGTFTKNVNTIQSGSVLFSYEESSKSIKIDNMFPIIDEVGKKLSGDGEYFNFTVSAKVNDAKKVSNLQYQISLTPDSSNTLEENYVRVSLQENGKEVSINGNYVNNFSDLADSKVRTGSKVLFTKDVKDDVVANYSFRMWLSRDYNPNKINKTFKCYVSVDAFVK